jgi:hypothetical protein
MTAYLHIPPQSERDAPQPSAKPKLRCRVFGHKLDIVPLFGGKHRRCSRCSMRVEADAQSQAA